MKPRLDNRLYYFTVEDESVLGETFPRFGEDTYAIAYKVAETEDVFVTTAETKDAMERHDVPYNGLAEEDGIRVSVFHSELSREELSDYEDALKALALAHRAIALLCVGVNGDALEFVDGIERYSYFNAPAGHVFVWRLFAEREEAQNFVGEHMAGNAEASEWASSLPIASNDELVGYH
ncbi:MAG: hypothetical protein AAF725_12550 [Acidobacteriota bacterium]